MNGLILVDKPSGMTSFSVAARLRRIYGTKKVGHTGTLDPMATGLLPVFIGTSTKLCSYMLDADKEYIAGIRLGVTTDTLDITGAVLSESENIPTEEEFCLAAKSFVGSYDQLPPMYSAIKKNGQRLYDLARKGETVERETRRVTIHNIEILEKVSDRDYLVKVSCSKGTYIRSLADDIGKKLLCGATLFSLRRTKTSVFSVEDAHTLEEIEQSPENFVLNPETAVEYIPQVFVSDKQATRFENGGSLDLARLKIDKNEATQFRVKNKDEFLGIGEIDGETNSLKMKCLVKNNFMQSKKTAIALGTFDGLHIGHLSVLSAVLEMKDMKHYVATFDEPPRRKSKNIDVPMLISVKLKNELLESMGFDKVISLDFDEIRNQSPEEFLKNLCKEYNVGAISCGFNYRFGKNGKGDADFIEEFCRKNGIVSVVCPEVLYNESRVSSTHIRNLVSEGEVSFANKLMSAPFTFEGVVKNGDSRGHTIGFPTINVPLDSNLVLPKFGSYASFVTIDGEKYKAVTNIGVHPTFNNSLPQSETYILDFSGDLYGKSVRISLMDFLREEQKFESVDELIAAIKNDCKETEKKLG